MRPLALSLRCVLLAVAMATSASLWAQPFGYGINSRGDFVQSDKVGALWTIDLATGDSSREGRTRINSNIFIEGLAFLPDGRLLGADDDTNTLILIGLVSGNATQFGSPKQDNNMGLPTGVHDFGMTFTCEEDLLVSTDSSALGQNLYMADQDTGKLTLIGSLGAPIVDMAAIGDRVYGIGRGIDGNGAPLAPNLYLIDPDAPSATLIGPLGPEAGRYNKAGLAADEDGNLWAITDRRSAADSNVSIASEILNIDPNTGLATRIASTHTDEGGEPLVGIESLAVTIPLGCEVGASPIFELAEPIPVLSDLMRWVLIMLLMVVAGSRLYRAQS